MICVTIVQESRRLALADMLNAAQLGADLVEVRLDKFDKDANLNELVAARKKPVLFSCRRPQDGGEWNGAEDERLMLLRSAVVAKADYVEVELDANHHVRPFPGCKRVVSYTNLAETPKDLSAIYERLREAAPDVIKVTCKADTPEEAWPLLQLLNKPPVPTVVVGLGPAGTMLALVGRKVGTPWTTAAIEKGMEAYPGQPTVRDLVEVYRYRDVGRKTRFVGVTGAGERPHLAAGLLNVAFAHLNMPHQALPLQMGNRRHFRKIADAIRLQDVFVDEEDYESLHEVAMLDESARSPVAAADGLAPTADGWSAYNALGEAAANALEATLNDRGPDESLKGRVVMLAGVGALTRMVAGALKARGASLIWASRDRDAAKTASQTFGGRQLLWDAVYATGHDVLVIGRDAGRPAGDELPFHPGFLKPSMCVLDLTAGVRPSQFLSEARVRLCAVVPPTRLLIEQVRKHVRRVGGDVSAPIIESKLADWLPAD
jgi:3-dehydroquinate dehydratase/shikimate dehydrogenase